MSPRPVSQGLAATLGLRQMIIDGELAAGDRLSELSLVQRLHVSRTPLRLALAQLAHEGLVEAQRGGGFAVRAFTLRQVADAVELRGVLEGTAARLAARRHGGEIDTHALSDNIARIDRLLSPGQGGVEDFGLYIEFNERFHNALLLLAASDPLKEAYDHVLALPFAAPSALVALQAEAESGWHETVAIAQHHHRSLLEAIEAGAGGRAESIAREHALLALQNLEAALHGDETTLRKLPGGMLITLDGAQAAPAGVR